jgi:branched-chain amino acid transport system substrate-binding protein
MLAVIGANLSDWSLAIAPILQEAGVVMISPISTNPAVTKVGSFIFRACFTDPSQGRLMARFALRQLAARRAAILKKADSSYSQGLAEQFALAFAEGGTVVWESTYMAGDLHFELLLRHLEERAPDVVFVPGHGPDVGRILKQAHYLGIETRFLGGDGWGKGVLGFSGSKAAEGHYFSNHWHQDVANQASRSFVKAYRERYREPLIASSAALAYDALLLLEDAVVRAGSLDRAAVRGALAATRGFQGVTGELSFDANGDPVKKEAVIQRYESGEIVLVGSFRP